MSPRRLAIALAPTLACGRADAPVEATDETTATGSGTSAAAATATSSAAGSDDADGSGPDAGTNSDTSAGDGSSSDAGSTGEPPADGCAVVGIDGTCIDVATCPLGSTAFGGESCDGPPTLQCCVPAEPPCSVGGAPGLCLDQASCAAPFVTTAGLCPGDASVQCCTDPETQCDPTAMPRPNEGLVEVAWDPACPAGMVPSGSVCIDRHEASLVELDDVGEVIGSWSPWWNPGGARVRAVSILGAIPQGYITQIQAAAACGEAGKRLCTDAEWLRACRGARGTSYPWGEGAMPGTCNDARAVHPAVEYFGTSDPSIFSMLDHPCISQIPASLATTGEHPGCVSEDGAFDLMGNLHEWTSDPAGTFRGGFFVDTAINGPGCLYATTAHAVSYSDYSTGFRCCADPS